jgi:methionine aminopeptidase
MEPWDVYLAALEANVERGWELLASGGLDGMTPDAVIPASVVPETPCPAGLLHRATEALRRVSELELAVDNRMHEVARELQRRPSLPPAPPRVGWGLSIRM